MPFDGSGTYNRSFPPGGWQGDSTANIKIKSDRHDQHDNDIAAALSMMICKDGQSSPSANINWNGKKILNLAAPTAATDAATKGYVDGVRNFPSAISITGSHPESLIKFTGTTGPWGLSFVSSGLSFGVSTSAFLWHESTTLSGSNLSLMTLTPGVLQVISNVDHGTMDPILYLDQNFPGVAANGLGSVYFRGKNSAGSTIPYIYFHNVIDTITAGSEAGTFSVRTMTAGATTAKLTLEPAMAYIHTPFTVSGATQINANLGVAGSIAANSYVGSSDTTLILHATGAGAVYFRPNGSGATSGQAYINTSGNMYVDGIGTFTGAVYAATNFISSGINVVVGQTGTGGNVYLRPNGAGSTAYQVQINENNVILNSLLNARNGASVTGNIDASASIIAQGGLFAQTGTSSFIGGYSGTGGGGGGVSINVWFRISAASSSSTGLYTHYNTNGAVGTISTSGSGTTYGTTSDAGLKSVNGEYDPLEAIAIIRADPVMAWTWLAKGSGDAVGWVAQKSYAVNTDLAVPPCEPNEEDLNLRVNRNVEPKPGEPGYLPWMMDYGKRTPYLWAALSWALDQIDDLKARLAAVEGTPA